MDEAGARKHITNIVVPKEIEEQEKLIGIINSEKNAAVKNQDFENAANLRDREKEMQNQLAQMKAEWEKSLTNNRQIVGDEDIAGVVSMISGVPMQRMQQDEWTRLKGMRNELTGKVIAQENAIGTNLSRKRRNNNAKQINK
jgi:ATP-dependent Clp protease ATP-binding subunit ClpC